MALNNNLKKQILMNLEGGFLAVAGAWPVARVGYSQVIKVT